MLASLRIRNLALIDEVELSLGEGLTVLTGETGAGKSIIVGALKLVLGDRASPEAIRQQAETAEVEALFELPPESPSRRVLDEMGLDDGDGAMVVRRVVSRAGRSRVYVNGRLCTLGQLRDLVAPLVDISSQHAHTSLLDVAQHRGLLDRFGDTEATLGSYAEAWGTWQAAELEVRALRAAERTRLDREGYLRFQLDELDELRPEVGEDETLEAELAVLSHATELKAAAQALEHRLYARSGSVSEQLAELERTLGSVASADPALATLGRRLDEARIEIDALARAARTYHHRLDDDPERLSEVEERLHALRQAIRRHGPTLDDTVRRHEAMREELAQLESLEESLTVKEKALAAAADGAAAAAARLTAARRAAADAACAAIERELGDLGMPGCGFEVSLRRLDALGPHGGDHVEFLLSPNRGEPALPLARIASGGELSRVMLAMKHALSTADTVDCYVFDEVDTGVGGGVAEMIGMKLHATAARRQVVCITHLAQVACHADHHLRVLKAMQEGRTVTRVIELREADREDEIARLMAGKEVTGQARAHASEMLRLARGAPTV